MLHVYVMRNRPCLKIFLTSVCTFHGGAELLTCAVAPAAILLPFFLGILIVCIHSGRPFPLLWYVGQKLFKMWSSYSFSQFFSFNGAKGLRGRSDGMI